MFMPAFVEPTLTEEQTSSVSARARGMERISLSSAGVMPFCTRAGEAADEVDARLAPGLVQRLGEAEIVLAVARARDEGNRRDGDALVDNRDAELGLYLLARAHKPLGPAGYLVVNLAAGGLRVAVAAVQKRNAHRDRAHVQMLLVYHLNGLEYFTAVYHAFDLQLPRTLRRR